MVNLWPRPRSEISIFCSFRLRLDTPLGRNVLLQVSQQPLQSSLQAVLETYIHNTGMTHIYFLPARRYASAGLCDSDVSVCLCPSVRPSVCHTPVLCVAERKQDHEMYTI